MPATYAIVVTRQWYGPRTTKSRHMDPVTGREWRGTRAQARAEVARMDRGDYELSHNESSRASYSLVRDDSEPRR